MNRKKLVIAIIAALLSLIFLARNLVDARNIPVTEQIKIDQFGWRPKAVKVVVFANPNKGQNSNVSYQPGSEFEIRREDTGQTVYTLVD